MMKKNILIAVMLLAATATFAQQTESTSIIPKPLSAQKGTGSFYITKQTTIVARSAAAKKVAEMFNYFMAKKYGFTLPVSEQGSANAIVLNVLTDSKPAAEGYKLTVTKAKIEVAGTKAGVFYGVQSLLQLMVQHEKGTTVNAVTINDEPNFAYRGLMLDVGRHFFGVDEIKKILDVMAYLKLNRFHWHLTDDQGWRLEIKKYPKLTSISAWRDSTIIGSYGDNKPFIYDGQKSGGFYTQEQAREVVKYAADRNIVVVPEIEMPGHSTAVLAAYPELGNDTIPYHVPGYWGVHRTIYSPGEQTFTFLQDVLTEVMTVFPSKFIHIGGDEVPKNEWKTSALAQSLIKQNNLKDENELQSWFINRIEKFLNKNGRNLIGWDEILEGGLSPNATVMSWRGEQGGIEAAKQSHNVVMTPGGPMYVDHSQAKDTKTEPLSIGGFLPIDVVYNYNPRPAVLTADQQKFIMGVQGNMWTEYVPTAQKLEYMIFPRALAIAEVGWTSQANKDFNNFSKVRLPVRLRDLDKFGINYRIPEGEVAISTDAVSGRKKITITPFTTDCKIYYTIDGHKVDNTGTLYTGPILAPFTNGRPLTLKYIIVNADNRVGGEYDVDVK